MPRRSRRPVAASAQSAPSAPSGNGGPAKAALPTFGPDQLIENWGAKGPFTYHCECPACGSKFIAGPFPDPPNPEQPMTCGLCNRGGIPFRTMREGFENKQRFFGEVVACQRPGCDQRYQPIMEGPSGYDERTGKGGMRRACPKCGWYIPTKRPVPNAAEDRKTDLSSILS
jgi:hypothetical protein